MIFVNLAINTFRYALDNASVLALGVLAFALFLRWERDGRSVNVPMVAIGVIMLDSALFPTYGSSNGVFTPYLMGRQLNAAYVLVPLGLVARAIARRTLGRPHPVEWLLMTWAVWYLTCAVSGAMDNNPMSKITYEAAAVLYICGTAWLVAGVSYRDWVSERGIPRLVRISAALAAAIYVLDATHTEYFLNLPGTTVYAAGRMGADSATVFASIGLLGLGIELTRDRRRVLQLLACLILLCAPLSTTQRAAILALVVSLAAVVLLWVFGGPRQVLRVRPTEVILALGLFAGLAAVPVFIAGIHGRSAVPDAISTSAETAFESTAKKQSAESRRNQWTEARRLVADRKLVGYGLGKQFDHFEVGPDVMWTQDITHNVGLDLALRSGYIGVGIFALAILGAAGGGLSALRRGPPAAGVLATLTVAALAGLLAKGMVESILDKYRTAFLLGVLLGWAYSAARTASMRDTGSPADTAVLARSAEPELVSLGGTTARLETEGRSWT